jgi:hypothetical protein
MQARELRKLDADLTEFVEELFDEFSGDDRAKARRNDRAQRDRPAACSVDVGVCPA